ncbi:MAG: DUF2958 domain-containing protein [Candidatus Paceibacterota bacterium]
MKLMTKELEEQFKKVGNQENVRDPIVVCKFFNPCGQATWLSTEYDPKTKIFFGYVSIFGDACDEWGSFSLKELEEITLSFGLKIERDLYFTPQSISKIMPKAVLDIN